MPQEAQAFGQRCLGLAGVPRCETVGDLRDPGQWRADQDLEQDLETDRVEPVEVDGRGPEGEHPAERVAHHREAARERALGQPGGPGRDERPSFAQAIGGRSRAGVPGAHHDVHVVPHRGAGQHRGRLGGMLQVGVHDEHPCAARLPRPGDDRATQAALAGAGLAVQQPDRYPARPGRGAERLGGAVVTVIHDDDLGIQRPEYWAEPLEQRADIEFFVAGRDEHGQGRRGLPSVVEIDEGALAGGEAVRLLRIARRRCRGSGLAELTINEHCVVPLGL